MPSYFIVRAQLTDAALKPAFERWYQDEHLIEARDAFQAQRASRGWSHADPNVHYAYYEFADSNAADALLNSETLKRLAAVFDQRWGNQVKRSREVVEIVQVLAE